MIYLLLILSVLPFLVPVAAKRTVATVAIGLVGLLVTLASLSVIVDFELPFAWLDLRGLTPVGAIFALLFSATFLSIMLTDRTDRHKSPALLSVFYASAYVLFISLLGVITAPTLWDFALSWELMGCSSFVVMLYGADRRECLHSAIVYFIAMHVGFIFILAGFLMIDSQGVHLWGGGSGIGVLAWLMFFVGFGLKSAIFPLHFWLPSAYRATSGTGSALLAGGATNVGLYGLLCITYNATGVAVAGFTLFCFGVVAALFGAFRMIRARTINDVLSYSSIENLGIIVMAFGLSFYAKTEGLNTVAVLAIAGGMLRMFNHAISKSLLFVTVGQLRRVTRTDMISDLGGLAHRMPFTTTGFAVGGLSLASMPPFGGFFSEFLIFTALFIAVSSQALAILAIVGIIALALASASTIFNISKSFGIAFLGHPRSEAAQSAKEHRPLSVIIGYAVFFSLATVASWSMCWWMMDHSVELFAVGVDATWIWDILIGVALTCAILIAVVALLWWVRWLLVRKRKNSIAPTWSCAYDDKVAPETQYTAESFASEASLVVEYKNSLHSKTRAALTLRVSPMRFMRRWTARLALLQTGRTSHYVMHIIWFLVLVLILTITSAI